VPSRHDRRVIVVVGAGLAGLVAARTLVAGGYDVVVLEKGTVPGGRLATVAMDAATLDTGAQFFTVRSDAFAALVDRWLHAGVVYEWNRGFSDPPDGHPRYAGRGGMAALAAHLAAGLDVRTGAFVFAVRTSGGQWEVVLDDGTSIAAAALVLTCPLPQSVSLLMTAEVELPEQLARTDYERTVALLAVLDGPSALPPSGGHQDSEGTFSFVADNQRKGVSTVPALTLHASPAASRARWDDPPEAVRRGLTDAARPWLGDARVVACRLRRWRFATPASVWPQACWLAADACAPLVLAGDAFAGPRVEGAVLSGLAAAKALA
jgi:renalase